MLCVNNQEVLHLFQTITHQKLRNECSKVNSVMNCVVAVVMNDRKKSLASAWFLVWMLQDEATQMQQFTGFHKNDLVLESFDSFKSPDKLL